MHLDACAARFGGGFWISCKPKVAAVWLDNPTHKFLGLWCELTGRTSARSTFDQVVGFTGVAEGCQSRGRDTRRTTADDGYAASGSRCAIRRPCWIPHRRGAGHECRRNGKTQEKRLVHEFLHVLLRDSFNDPRTLQTRVRVDLWAWHGTCDLNSLGSSFSKSLSVRQWVMKRPFCENMRGGHSWSMLRKPLRSAPSRSAHGISIGYSRPLIR